MSDHLPWRYLCYRFIGRSRRLERFKSFQNPKTPDVIIQKEKELIQKAYEEMRDACLDNAEYQALWESKLESKESKNG